MGVKGLKVNLELIFWACFDQTMERYMTASFSQFLIWKFADCHNILISKSNKHLLWYPYKVSPLNQTLTLYTQHHNIYSPYCSLHISKVLTRRICKTIQRFISCWSFPSFSWLKHLIQGIGPDHGFIWIVSFLFPFSLLLFLFFIIQDRKEIVGELQFAFVCFLVGQGRYFAFIYLCSLM